MVITQMKGQNEQEELFYRKHIVDALGKDKGELYLQQVDATREFYSGLPAIVDAQLKDILNK